MYSMSRTEGVALHVEDLVQDLVLEDVEDLVLDIEDLEDEV